MKNTNLKFFLFVASLFFFQLSFGAIYIDNLQNYRFGNLTPDTDYSQTGQGCVYVDNDDNSYYVTITGDTTGGNNFVLRSGNDFLPIKVEWQAVPGSGNYVELNNGIQSHEFLSASRQVNCGGGTDFYLRITISQQDIGQAAAGNYSGNLKIKVQSVKTGAVAYGATSILAPGSTSVRIFGLVAAGDIAFGTISPATTVDSPTRNFCVAANAPRNYQVRGSANASGLGAFVLINGANNLPYTVTWYTAINYGGTAYALTAGVYTATIGGAGNNFATCGAAQRNVSVKVTLTNTNMLAVPAGAYSGTLYLTVRAV
jgi:hypothetical protein